MEINISYKAAMEELSSIAAAMEEEAITIDELAEKVKRAQILIKYCDLKLKNAEEDVQLILNAAELTTGDKKGKK